MSALQFTMSWQGIELEVQLQPRLWGVTSHLEIRTIRPERAPLPITETGYKSHFLPIGSFEEDADKLEQQINDWLDKAAHSPEWQDAQNRAAQGELF